MQEPKKLVSLNNKGEIFVFTNLDATVIHFVNSMGGKKIQSFGIPSNNLYVSIFIPAIGETIKLSGLLFKVKNVTRIYPTSIDNTLEIIVTVERI